MPSERELGDSLRDHPTLLFKVSFGCSALAVLLLLAYAIAPAILAGLGEESEFAVAAKTFFPVASMLLIVLAGVIGAIAQLLLIYEIATSKNDRQWKTVWIIVVLVFSIVGIGAYMAGARKERKV